MLVALNIVFATVVIVAIVGGLAWSVTSQGLDTPAGLPQRARRRRRSTARDRFIGQTVEHRA